MAVYFVEKKEVHIQGVMIEADTALEALDLVNSGEGVVFEGDFHYSETLPSDFTNVRFANQEEIEEWEANQ